MEFETVIQFISIGGGLSGFASIILLIKSMMGRLRIFPEKGLYLYRDFDKTKFFEIGFAVLFLNGKENPVSITDVSAVINYKNNKNHSKKKLENFDLIPLDIMPKSSEKPQFIFTFYNPPQNDTPENLDVTFKLNEKKNVKITIPLLSSDEYNKVNNEN